MQIASSLQDEICLPNALTGNETTEIFIRTLREMESAAVQGKAVPTDVNPFFTEAQSSSLAASLGMQFKCPPRKK
jgi:hypothetical protein